MFVKRFAALFLLLCMLPAVTVAAAEVESGASYCFSPGDFSDWVQDVKRIRMRIKKRRYCFFILCLLLL